MKKDIKIFYYLYIPPDLTSVQWTWFIDQQIGELYQSGLIFAAKTNLIVYMPMHWTVGANGSGFFKNNVKIGESHISFAEKLKEYISCRYPLVEILEIRDISMENTYEGYPLSHVYDTACKEDLYILYFHAKGVSRSSVCQSNWREVLNYYIIHKWKAHIDALDRGYEVSAMGDLMTEKYIVSGNYFWANSDYVKTLTNPLNITSYAKQWVVDEKVHERYAYEKWIRSNNPQINWIHNTNVDHYSSYYFIESIK